MTKSQVRALLKMGEALIRQMQNNKERANALIDEAYEELKNERPAVLDGPKGR